MDVQDQIYIVSGVLGGVSAVLLITIIVQFYEIYKLKNDFKKHKNLFKSNYAYLNPEIMQNEELNRRGYSQHMGDRYPDFRMSSGGQKSNPNWQSPATEDASKDFSKILTNDNIIFGGDSDNKRSNLKPTPPMAYQMKNKPYDNIAFNPYNQQQSNSSQPQPYFNNRAMNVY